jgi:DNA gyrase subunit A
MADYPRKGRPTKGVRTIKVTDRKGELVTARPVRELHQLLLVSLGGQVIRIDVSSVRRTGRSTEGVRLMEMGDDDQIASVAAVLEQDDTPEPTEPGAESETDDVLEVLLELEADGADPDIERSDPE